MILNRVLQLGPLSLTRGADFPKRIVEVLQIERVAFYAEWKFCFVTAESATNPMLSPMSHV